MSGRLATVFGGTGFIGRYVVQRLAAQGWRVRVAVRDTLRAEDLRPLGQLGQINAVPATVTNEAQVRAAVDGADVVINLVGILYERGKRTFEKLHVEGAGIVARAAADAGGGALVHMSALGADPASASKYARSKAAGEAAVHAAYPKASIIRPSVVFGEEDGFFNLYGAIAQWSPVIPYFCHGVPHDPVKGVGSSFQPVYVGDVADAIVACAAGGKTQGKVYELGGPAVYSMREIVDMVNRETCRDRHVMGLPFFVAKVQALFLQFLPKPLLTPDQVTLLDLGSVVGGSALGLSDLGIDATPVEAVVPHYLDRFRPFGRHKRMARG